MTATINKITTPIIVPITTPAIVPPDNPPVGGGFPASDITMVTFDTPS